VWQPGKRGHARSQLTMGLMPSRNIIKSVLHEWDTSKFNTARFQISCLGQADARSA